MSANGSTVTNGGVIQATGGVVALIWGSTGATSCTLNGVVVPSSGAQTFTGVTASDFTYTCTNTSGSKSLKFSTVVPTPKVTINLSPKFVVKNDTSTPINLSYSTNFTVSMCNFFLTDPSGTYVSAGSLAQPSYSWVFGEQTFSRGVKIICEDTLGSQFESEVDLTVCETAIAADGNNCIGQVAYKNLTKNTPLVLGSTAKTFACADISQNLHRGAESTSVSSLQSFLVSKGLLSSEVTGFYGDKTVEAVKDYQGSKGLPVTGMVYEYTRGAIKSETCQ